MRRKNRGWRQLSPASTGAGLLFGRHRANISRMNRVWRDDRILCRPPGKRRREAVIDIPMVRLVCAYRQHHITQG
jgi:hypothetical protein